MEMISNNTYCLVCGFDWTVPLVDESESFQRCDCCGSELNYHYEPNGTTPIEHIRKIRNSWLSKKALWFDDETKPKGWNKEMALAQIKANVPPEFQ